MLLVADKGHNLSFLLAGYTQRRLKAHLFPDSLVIVWRANSSQINCPNSQAALIKQITGTVQTAPGSSGGWVWSQQSPVPGQDCLHTLTSPPECSKQPHPCPHGLGFLQGDVGTPPRWRKPSPDLLECYLELRSTETPSWESAGCPLLCCFLEEWVVCFHHLGMQAWERRAEGFRKADI